MSDATNVTKRDVKELQTELLNAIETKFKIESKSELTIFTGKKLEEALKVKANTLISTGEYIKNSTQIKLNGVSSFT